MFLLQRRTFSLPCSVSRCLLYWLSSAAARLINVAGMKPSQNNSEQAYVDKIQSNRCISKRSESHNKGYELYSVGQRCEDSWDVPTGEHLLPWGCIHRDSQSPHIAHRILINIPCLKVMQDHLERTLSITHSIVKSYLMKLAYLLIINLSHKFSIKIHVKYEILSH